MIKKPVSAKKKSSKTIKPIVQEKEVLASIESLSVGLNLKTEVIAILQNVSFKIHKGEVLALVGESGCGKSLTSLTLTRLLPIKTFSYLSGQILFESKNIFSLSNEDLRQLRGKDISYIFQDPFTSLNPTKKIRDQIIEPYLIHISENYKEADDKAKYLLNRVGLTELNERLNSYPGQLSGGMLQRICIAIALMCDPKLLIADEPTSALDVTIQSQLVELLMDLKSENNMSILFISHDLPLVSTISDRIAVMYAGQIAEMGNTDTIISNPVHPYTTALLNSIPSAKDAKKQLKVIDGLVPSPKEYPVGCHFYERCESRMDKCLKGKPEFTEIEYDHYTACFASEKKK